MTHAQFKKVQLDHLIDVILEAGGDVNHAARRLANDYPTNNVQDYMTIEQSELDNRSLPAQLYLFVLSRSYTAVTRRTFFQLRRHAHVTGA